MNTATKKFTHNCKINTFFASNLKYIFNYKIIEKITQFFILIRI